MAKLEVEHIKESYGTCSRCNKEAILGDGLCERCWDAKEDGVREFQRSPKEELFIDQLLDFGPTLEGDFKPALKEDSPELQEAISEVLPLLTERQRKVIVLRFGLEGERSRTLREIGQEFNLTRERIRQIEGKALRRLWWQAHLGKVSRKIKACFENKEPTTHGEVLLRAIFSIRFSRRGNL